MFCATFIFQTHSRACLKNHSRDLHAPLCGIFCPNSVAVARYGAFIRTKSPTNCDAHLAESLFQTRSRKPAGLRMNPEINSCAQIAEVLKYMKITQLKLEQECQHV